MFFKDSEATIEDATAQARSSDGADSSLRRSNLKACTSGRKSSVSLGTVDDDTGDVSDEFDTAVKRNRKKMTSKTSKITKKNTSGKKDPGGTTRRTWPLDQGKRLRRPFRGQMMQGRLPGRAV